MEEIKFETADLYNVLNVLIDDLFDNTSTKCPDYDVIENDNEFIVKLVLAGIKKNEISVETENGVLTIKTERKKVNTENYKRIGLYYGKYEKSITLPDDVDAEKIKANLIDGILTLTIQKTVNEIKNKKIIIK